MSTVLTNVQNWALFKPQGTTSHPGPKVVLITCDNHPLPPHPTISQGSPPALPPSPALTTHSAELLRPGLNHLYDQCCTDNSHHPRYLDEPSSCDVASGALVVKFRLLFSEVRVREKEMLQFAFQSCKTTRKTSAILLRIRRWQ